MPLPGKNPDTFDTKNLAKAKNEIKGFSEFTTIALRKIATSGKVMGGVFLGLVSTVKHLYGPLGATLGLIMGLVGGFRLMGKQLETVARGINFAANTKKLEASFKNIMSGAENAKKKIAELVRFAATTPFTLDQAADSSRSLQLLTKGALNTEGTMRKLGDAAISTGNDLTSVSGFVAKLYSALQNGQPIEGALSALSDMGVIAPQVAQHLATLQSNGAKMAELWPRITAEIEKHTGASKEMQNGLDGLNKKLEAARDTFATQFGKPFLAAEEKSVIATTKFLEAMTPAAKTLAEAFYQLKSPYDSFVNLLKSSATVLPYFAEGIKTAAQLFKVLVLVIAGAKLQELALGFLAVSKNIIKKNIALEANTKELLKNLAAIKVTKAQEAEHASILAGTTAAVNKATTAEARNAAAMEGYTMANKAGTVSTVQLTAALTAQRAVHGAALTATMRYTAAQKIFGFAMRASAVAVGFVATSLKALAQAIKANWILALAAAIYGLYSMITSRSEEAAAALKELADANKEVEESLKKESDAIRTVDDKYAHLTKTTNELAAARSKLNKLIQEGAPREHITAQQAHVNTLTSHRNDVRGLDNAALQMGQRELEILQKKVALQRELNDAEYAHNMALAGGNKQYELAQKKLEELLERQRTAEKEQAGDKDYKSRVEGAASSAEGDKAELARAEASFAKAKADREAAEKAANIPIGTKSSYRMYQSYSDGGAREQSVRRENLASTEAAEKAAAEELEKKRAAFLKSAEARESAKWESTTKSDALSVTKEALEAAMRLADPEQKAKMSQADILDDEIKVNNRRGNLQQLGITDFRDPRQLAAGAAKVETERAKLKNEDPQELQKQANALKQENELRKRELEITQKIAASEIEAAERIRNIRNSGVAAAHTEAQIRIEALKKQAAAEESRHTNAADRAESRRPYDEKIRQEEAALDRSRKAAQIAAMDNAEGRKVDELRLQQRFGNGDRQGAKRQANALEGASEVRQRAIEIAQATGVSAGQAYQQAQAQWETQKKLSAADPQVIADSLQSVGLGGGASVSDPLLAINQQIADVQKEQKRVLEQIRDRLNPTTGGGRME